MVTAEIIYTGDIHTEAVHLGSGNKITTDGPKDNHGKGQAFSPTDLTATSLACCMLSIMGILGKTHDINIDGTSTKVTKIMAANPRRISEVVVEVTFPRSYSKKEMQMLENAARTCPVSLSLHPDLKQTMIFNFPE